MRNLVAAFPAGDIDLWALGRDLADSVDKPLMIYDSACPPGGIPGDCSGNDPDLGTPNQAFGGPGVGFGGTNPAALNDVPLGNILIISRDGNSADPNDDERGGIIRFNFHNVTVGLCNLTLVDVDDTERNCGFIAAFNASGDLIGRTNFATTGDNSVQTVLLMMNGAMRLDVALCGSGAISSLCITPEVDVECETDGECDDEDACTRDACVDGECVNEDRLDECPKCFQLNRTDPECRCHSVCDFFCQIPDPNNNCKCIPDVECRTDEECFDGDGCTTEFCAANGTCVSGPPTVCDDG